MFEIKLWGKCPTANASFWQNLPKEIHLIEVLEKPTGKAHLDQDQADQFYLFYEGNRLTLGFTHEILKSVKPLSFDWEDTISSLRKTLRGVKEESLYKALAIQKNKDPMVADATLGTGKDALLMRLMGAKVDGYERNPWVYLLALDAFRRLSNKDSLTINFGSPDKEYPFIYFDPMFPEKKKSALPPKEMQIFKLLVGEDIDQESVALKLLHLAQKRLLVKRPSWALPVLPKPHMSYESKLMRLDAYVQS
ncbi:MAG: class I SAM-dependent methyltransferase [Bacteriovoracaceae bacterium]